MEELDRELSRELDLFFDGELAPQADDLDDVEMMRIFDGSAVAAAAAVTTAPKGLTPAAAAATPEVSAQSTNKAATINDGSRRYRRGRRRGRRHRGDVGCRRRRRPLKSENQTDHSDEHNQQRRRRRQGCQQRRSTTSTNVAPLVGSKLTSPPSPSLFSQSYRISSSDDDTRGPKPSDGGNWHDRPSTSRANADISSATVGTDRPAACSVDAEAVTETTAAATIGGSMRTKRFTISDNNNNPGTKRKSASSGTDVNIYGKQQHQQKQQRTKAKRRVPPLTTAKAKNTKISRCSDIDGRTRSRNRRVHRVSSRGQKTELGITTRPPSCSGSRSNSTLPPRSQSLSNLRSQQRLRHVLPSSDNSNLDGEYTTASVGARNDVGSEVLVEYGKHGSARRRYGSMLSMGDARAISITALVSAALFATMVVVVPRGRQGSALVVLLLCLPVIHVAVARAAAAATAAAVAAVSMPQSTRLTTTHR